MGKLISLLRRVPMPSLLALWAWGAIMLLFAVATALVSAAYGQLTLRHAINVGLLVVVAAVLFLVLPREDAR